MTENDARVLLRELQTRQIELEAQNAGLRNALVQADDNLARYVELYDYSPVGCVVLDGSGTIVQANIAAGELLGIERGKLAGKRFEPMIVSRDRPSFRAFLEKLFNGCDRVSCELTLGHQGKVRYLLVEARMDEAGETCRVGLTDITGRKLVEEDLRRSETRFRYLADGGRALIWTCGPDRHCDYFNRPWLEFTGRSMEQERGDGWTDGVHPEDLERCLQTYATAFERREKFSMIYRLRRYDGVYRWIIDEGTPSLDESGNFIGYIGHGLDITEIKQSKEDLIESYHGLEKLATLLEDVREQEQNRIARELHDEMGAVLTSLNIHVSLLAQKVPARMKRLKSEADALVNLVSKGIQAMRHTVAKLRPSLLDEIGLKFAIERYAHEFLCTTNIDLELRLPDDLVLDGTRSAAIFRIVQESLTNITKHSQASKVSVVLSEWDGSLMLTVRDNGKGFDPRQKTRSLGLIGIRERAALVGGKAEISSAPGKGTTVRASFPQLSRTE